MADTAEQSRVSPATSALQDAFDRGMQRDTVASPQAEDAVASVVQAIAYQSPDMKNERMLSLVSDILNNNDANRTQAGASLVNVFNFAIQQQAGRQTWNEADFRAFIVAYEAIDSIGRESNGKILSTIASHS